MDIALIIIAGISLLVLVITLVIVLKKKNVQPVQDDKSYKELVELQTKIGFLPEQLKNDVELAVNKEVKQIQTQNNALNETNNEKLERFQKSINESINTRFDALNEQMNSRLNDINKKVDEKLAEGFKGTSETMTQVRERLKAIDEAQKNIENLSKDVVSLKTVLEGNQSRGQYGEFQLDMLLHNVFGDTVGCYEEQYTIKKSRDGEEVRADAVVFMPEPNHMICVDSKFPFSSYSKLFETNDDKEKEELLKSFNGEVKKHITDIKNKYIIDGKTAMNAIMFIPNDGIFAFIHQNCPSLVEYAREVKVIITSPSTLPSILWTINMVRIESERSKNVREISKQLTKLGKDFNMFSKEWETFSSSLDKVSRGREKLDSRVDRITNRFDSISGNTTFEIEEKENNNDVISDLSESENN